MYLPKGVIAVVLNTLIQKFGIQISDHRMREDLINFLLLPWAYWPGLLMMDRKYYVC